MDLAPITLALDDDGGTPPSELLAVLAGEALDVRPVALTVALGSDPARCDVLMVWSPRGLTVRTCERIVHWAQGRTPAVGLALWSEHAERAQAERALAAGFDDAQTGPCSPRELAVRLRALQRRVRRHAARAARGPTGRLRVGDLLLDPETCQVWIDRQPVSLTFIEVHVLLALLDAKGSVLTRGELLDRAWGGDQLSVGERAVDNMILRLRRKLGRPDLIQTVRGVGFRLDVETDARPDARAPAADPGLRMTST